MADRPRLQEIKKDVIDRLCAEQVLSDVTSAVKELVENSLDAKATNIAIILANGGVRSLTVHDNGVGIERTQVALAVHRHATSKMDSLDQLNNGDVHSLGFRGEALHSIALLSESLTIWSRHRDALAVVKAHVTSQGVVSSMEETHLVDPSVGIEDWYDQNHSGTVMCIKNLFSCIPVRRKEMIRHVSSQISKTVQFIAALAVINPSVIFRIEEERKQHQRRTLFESQGTFSSPIDAFCRLSHFDPQQMRPMEIEGKCRLRVTVSAIDDHSSTRMDIVEAHWRLSGAIAIQDGALRNALAAHKSNVGQSLSRRQTILNTNTKLLFYKGRPVHGPAAMNRAIMDEVKLISSKRQCAYLFILEAPPSVLDVNVTPDKQTLVFNQVFERQLVNTLRKEIKAALHGCVSTVTTNKRSSLPSRVDEHPPVDLRRGGDSLSIEDSGMNPTINPVETSAEINKVTSMVIPHEKRRKLTHAFVQDSGSMASILTPITVLTPKLHLSDDASATKLKSYRNAKRHDESSLCLMNEISMTPIKSETTPMFSALTQPGEYQPMQPPSHTQLVTVQSDDEYQPMQPSSHTQLVTVQSDDEYQPMQPSSHATDESDWLDKVLLTVQSSASSQESSHSMTRAIDSAQYNEGLRKITDSNCDLLTLSNAVDMAPSDSMAVVEDVFDERVVQLPKGSFKQMVVHGQFNKGFIITSLPSTSGHQRHIFLVDQHASDEKIRFEYLERTLVVRHQNLIVPHPLCLPMPIYSWVVQQLSMNHDDISLLLQRQGFTITEQEDGLYLTSKPNVMGHVLDVEDLIQLIDLLIESEKSSDATFDAVNSGASVRPAAFGSHSLSQSTAHIVDEIWKDKPWGAIRPPRTWFILASKACRGAIMVGTVLGQKHMRRVIDGMALLEQPWNCPHGRPTCRMLASI